MDDLDVDDNDEVTFTGHATGDVSFGGEPIGLQYTAYIAKLSGAGVHIFSQAFNSTLTAALAVHPGGNIAVLGLAGVDSEVSIGRGTARLPAMPQRYAALLDASSTLQWATAITAVDNDRIWDAAAIAIDREGNVLVSDGGGHAPTPDGQYLPTPLTLSKLAPDGAALWTKVIEDTARSDEQYDHAFDADSHGNIVLARSHRYLGSAESAADAGTLEPYDVIVLKLSPEGDAVSQWVLEAGAYNWSGALDIDIEDAVWTTHNELDDASLLTNKCLPSFHRDTDPRCHTSRRRARCRC